MLARACRLVAAAVLLPLVPLVLVTGGALGSQATAAQTRMVTLVHFWDSGNTDAVTVVDIPERMPGAASHEWLRVEGLAFAEPLLGTTPLKLYLHRERSDYVTVATEASERDLRAAGYEFVQVEAYIYPRAFPGTTPLHLYWSEDWEDFFTAASAGGVENAEEAGYVPVRVEGYVVIPPP